MGFERSFFYTLFLSASVRFTTVIADDTFIYLSWDDDQPVAISGYRLKFGVEGQAQDGLENLPVDNSLTYSHTISSLETGTLYRIGLYQVLLGGAENFQSSVIIRTSKLSFGVYGLKDLGTFVKHKSQCPRIYIKLTQFENNDSRKLS